MKSAPKKWDKKPILIGLSVHCAFWWTWLSVTEMREINWGSHWQGWLEIGWSTVIGWVVLPFTFGHTFLPRVEFYWWAALRVLITFALIAMTCFAVRTHRRRDVVLAHCTVFLYWAASAIIWVSALLAEAATF